MKTGKVLIMLALAFILASCTAQSSSGRSDPAELEWSFQGTEQQRLLTDVIRSANSTLDIAIYSLTEPGIVSAILDAKKRGVAVRVITDRQQAGGKTQAEALKLLGSAGIPIKMNAHDGLMHLKMTVADRKTATTGSLNYSKSAFKDNDEMLVVVRNPSAAESFGEQFDRLWRDGRRFESAEFRIARPEAGEGKADAVAAGDGASVYPNCAAARAAGKAPLRRGDPGYSAKLDGDGDGVACEKR